MKMAESIRAFENSLRDFLINAQSDSYNTHGKSINIII